MDITEVRGQNLASIVNDFCICRECGIVDRDPKRSIVGTPCSHCGTPSPGGEAYFGLFVSSTINLMQELYHAKRSNDPQARGQTQLIVVVLFCTLVECLTENLLSELMLSKGILPDERNKRLRKAWKWSDRTGKLFRELTGEEWLSAVAAVEPDKLGTHITAMEFYAKSATARNRFLHRGSYNAISGDMPKISLTAVPTVLRLFAAIHNAYAAKNINGTQN